MQENSLPQICLIVSSQAVPEKVERALKSGIRWIQYREKSLSRKEIFKYAEILRKITFKYNSLLTINDHLDIAIAVAADGVHLGQDDFPASQAKKIFSGIVGLSTHTLEEVMEAQESGVDYIGFGPMFPTTTKKDALVPRSLIVLESVIKKSSIPVLPIGGIKRENLELLLERGITHIAVSSGILEGDISKNIENFIKLLKH